MGINDRLSTILTQHAGEMAFVQRSQHNQFMSISEETHKVIASFQRYVEK